MKLALKLSLFLVIGVFLVLAADSLINIRRELGLQLADMRHDQHITGQALAGTFADMWRAGGRAEALAMIERANMASGQRFVRWVDLDAFPGTPYAPREQEIDLAPLAQGREVQGIVGPRHGPHEFVTYVPIRLQGTAHGAIELSEPIESAQYIRSTLLRRIVTATVLAALSGWIAVLIGAMFVGRPIRMLVGKTRRIAAGDFTQPLQLSQRDEIGSIAREIDAMCEQLATAREQLVVETTARIEAIDQMRHADRLATVGKLASGVAHELGTPLNVASQRAKMIASGEVAGAEAAAGARIIAEQTHRMTSVIRQLLDFARHQTPHKARQELGVVARQTATLLAPLARRRGVTIRVDEPGGVTVAEVDAAQIQQALTNLVVNGIQAMPNGGDLSITIETKVLQPPGQPGAPARRHGVISVRDQGVGIPAEHMAHVFEPFFTTKEVGEGTGLGLAVTYGIVRDHGGWIDFESTPGRGSRFAIVLPAPPGFEAVQHAPNIDLDDPPSEVSSSLRGSHEDVA
jgi:two-component system NtrC family sensor kinase